MRATLLLPLLLAAAAQADDVADLVRGVRAIGVPGVGPFFESWGVPTSNAARASVANLPAWKPGEK